MKISIFKKGVLFLMLGFWTAGTTVFAVSATPALLKAKKESETKGFLFAASHDEIVAKAKKEGRVHAVSSMNYPTIQAMEKAFRKKYPFLDATLGETTGTDADRRFLLELKAGRVTFDMRELPTDSYDTFLPHMKKIDILGMVKNGVLNIPAEVIDQENRNVVSITCNMQVTAYNKNLMKQWNLSIPQTWEDFLKPEYKGKKFVADIRPTEIAALVPAWGLEKVLDFARKLAAQEPVWARGSTRTLTGMAVGEQALFIGANYHGTRRTIENDPTKSLDYVVMEPVPVRPTEAIGILNSAKHPYAALLFLEFMASPEGQRIADIYEPYGASVFFPGGTLNKAAKGKKLSLATWEDQQKMAEWQKMIVEAYGFPTAEIKRKKKK